MKSFGLGLLVAVCLAMPARAEDLTPSYASPTRTGSFSIVLGGYKPNIDSENGLTGSPYSATFGNSSMLLFELEGTHYFWQGVGALGLAFSLGYAEKYAPATAVTTGGTTQVSEEKTALKVVPLRLSGVYRFDYPALRLGIPIIPYAKLALIYTPWWILKGSGVEYFNGQRGAGGEFGFGVVGGVSLMLDFLDPTLASDLRTDAGLVHSYLFAEYRYDDVNDFGGGGLVLSDNYWMFGISFDF